MSAARRRAVGLLAAAAIAGFGLAAASRGAFAQAPAHDGGLAAPDVPAGDATLRVRLVDPDTPGSVADAEVILYSLSPDGRPGLRRGRTDAQGRAVFESLSNAPGVVYLVGTRIGGVPFGSRMAFEAGERERDVVVAIHSPSADASGITPGATEIRVERGCSDLRLRHTHVLNLADAGHVIRVPPEAREGATPLFEIELPEDASEIETPLGAGDDSFTRDGRMLRFWGPLYPNDPQIEFGYAVPQDADHALAVGFPRGSGPVTLLAPRGGVEVAGAALVPGEPVTLQSGEFRTLEHGELAPGDALSFRLSATEVPRDDRVKIAETRIWIELDDAAMEVNEVHQLSVEGSAALPASAQAPLLCLPIPPEAQDVGLSNASFEMGVSRDAAGAIAIQGPLPAGESSVALRYRLPVVSEPAVFERTFSREIPLLSVLVADTGVVPHTTRLHTRRPVRTEDLAYLYLEGFGIEPGDPVRIAFERISLARGGSPLLSGGFVFLAACAALVFLVGPLRGQGDAGPLEGAVAPERSTEREAVYQAIEALDEDFETGKISAEDHARMRDELRAKAVALLQAEREAQAERAAAQAQVQTAPAAFCHACGAPTRAGDRFCSRCGTALAARETAAS